jgi:serine/threonine protein kinase
MVTGMLPCTSENQIELFREIKEATFDIPTYWSPALQCLLERMLSKDPSKRVTIAEVLASPWFPAAPVRSISRASSYSPAGMRAAVHSVGPKVLAGKSFWCGRN